MSALAGIHPRWERYRLVAIRFDPKVGPYAEFERIEDGQPMVTTLAAAFLGPTLTEVRRLDTRFRVVEGGLADKLRVSVESIEKRKR